jgi:hypothetical protein
MEPYGVGVSHSTDRALRERRTLWEEGREPGRQVVVLGVAVALSALALDLALGGDVGLFFDLCFVALCLGLALAVRPVDFFTVGVLPPLLMVGVLLLLEVTRPDVLGHPRDGAVQSLVTGLADHSGALVAGYALTLATLAVRHRYAARPRPDLAQPLNREGSPAPTRTTSG